jgi:serine/threonine-protein kinase
MADVFLSYKSEDRPRVSPLVRALEADGLSVWWDEQIEAGSGWRQAIQQELDAAKCVLVAWTRRSVGPEGEFVHDEATRAKRRQAYLPVLFDPVDPPLGFGEMQALPLMGWKGNREDARYQAVLEAAREILSGTAPSISAPVRKGPSVSRRGLVGGGVALGGAALAGGAWYLLRPGPAAASQATLAVLPFEALSKREEDVWLADGIAEEVRAALSQIQDLRVMARKTSQELQEADDTLNLARKLGLTHFLSGTLRPGTERLRVSIQLIDVATGLEKLAETYDMAVTDQFALQHEIAGEVLNALNIAIGSKRLSANGTGGTTNAKAQQLFWRAGAKNNGERQSLIQGVALLDQAIRLDPGFVNAYVNRGAMLLNLADKLMPAEADVRTAQARESYAMAMKLAPGLPAVQMAQATLHRIDLRFRDSLAWYRKAMAQPGSDSRIATNFATTLARLAHYTEAQAAAQKAVDMDPLNNIAWLRKARALYRGHNFAEAEAALEEAIRLNPTYFGNFTVQSELAWRRGDKEEALAALGRIRNRENAIRYEIILHARLGDRARVEQLKAESAAAQAQVDSVRMAAVHCCLGEQDAALSLLERTAARREASAVDLPSQEDLKPLYDHPRFRAVVKVIDYPPPLYPSPGDIGFYR